MLLNALQHMRRAKLFREKAKNALAVGEAGVAQAGEGARGAGPAPGETARTRPTEKTDAGAALAPPSAP